MHENELAIDYATKGTRLANNLIDTICFWIVWIAHVFLFEGWQN